jgi:uncharacterized DUF497 family protein
LAGAFPEAVGVGVDSPRPRKITGFVWLEEVVDKLQRKHGVEPDEVEEALTQKARIRRIEAGKVQGEDLYAGVGRTVAGRHLIVFLCIRGLGRH